MFSTVPAALAALQAGKPVLVLDDKNRENEGDAIIAASKASEKWIGWMIRHTSGYLCAPMTNERADALELPLMVSKNEDLRNTAYTISVDAKHGITTGISAHDRTLTALALANAETKAADLIRPGHILPLRGVKGGVLRRGGHTEAAIDLCRLAGLPEVGVIGELVHDDGSMMRTDAVLQLGAETDLPVITVADLVAYRQRFDRVVEEVVTTLPTDIGEFELHAFRDVITGDELVAMVKPWRDDTVPLVRLHSECFTGDIMGSLRCDCGEQLEKALQLVQEQGGAVVYLTGHEGRGVGLINKLRAYVEQDNGADTVDAQTNLGLPIDAREYFAGCAVLRALGIEKLRLLTNNPAKVNSVTDLGLEVTEVVASKTAPRATNRRYLETKRDRMGHSLELEG